MAFCYSIANIYANKHRYWLQKVLISKLRSDTLQKQNAHFNISHTHF